MRFLYLIGILLLSLNLLAQRPGTSGESRDQDRSSQVKRISQLKKAKLASDMKLSKSQDEKFWPVYNTFDTHRRELRREINQLSRNITEDDDAYKKQEKLLDLKQRELDLIKRYKPDFLKVISEQQFGIMLTSEERFNRAVLEHLKERNKD